MRTWCSILAALALVVLGAAPASAHLLLEEAVPQGDGSVELRFTFDHSCEDALTTGLAITMPSGSTVEDATGPDGWVAEPTDAEVTFSGPGLETSEGEAFTVTARLTGSAGDLLLFPSEQSCDNGDAYSWSEQEETGERPAPRIVATAATATPEQAATADGSGGASGRQVLASVVAFAGLAGAGAWLARRGAAG